MCFQAPSSTSNRNAQNHFCNCTEHCDFPPKSVYLYSTCKVPEAGSRSVFWDAEAEAEAEAEGEGNVDADAEPDVDVDIDVETETELEVDCDADEDGKVWQEGELREEV
jgi:hypothetical protein